MPSGEDASADAEKLRIFALTVTLDNSQFDRNHPVVHGT
jgi:hypothetical protein